MSAGSPSASNRASGERDVVTIGGREYHEFSNVVEGAGGRSQYLLQYISIAKALDNAFVVNVRSENDVLPEDARAIMEGVAWTDSTPSPAKLAMERGARALYNATLARADGLPSDEDLGDIEKEFAGVLESDPLNAKAHLFLAAAELLAEDPGPAFREAKCEAVKLGLWDYFCVSDKGILLHSLFDGFSPAEKAIEHLDAAVRADPRSFWASYYLAGFCIRIGEYTRAETCARAITENYPESALGWYALGLALKRNGKSAAAKNAFSTALYNNRGEFAELWWGDMRGKTIIDWQLKSLGGGR
jgi:tetratricopeptide (TPR) repeat protein